MPTAFVDRYMPYANEEAVKVYLYLLCHFNDASLTIENVAKTFGITNAKVDKVLKYWNDQGVIAYSDADDCACEPCLRRQEQRTCC